MGEFFNTVFVDPILNVLVAFYKLFQTIGLPGAFGFAIIAITVAVRLLLHPFFKKQTELTKKMQDMKPHLDKIQKKHKDDPKALQSAQMQLYKEMGVNPAAGCLFAIVQIPLFIGLYQTLQLFLKDNSGNQVVQEINKQLYFPFLKITSIDPTFFGLNLALSPSNADSYWFLIFPLLTAFLQYLQNRITLPQQAPAIKEDKDAKGEKTETNTADEFQRAMNTQMKYFFPVMIGYFSYSLPLGLSLYWNIFSVFSIIQHMHITKPKKVIEHMIEEVTGESESPSSKKTKKKKK